MNIGERIRKLRKTLDLTQQKFGERIGIKGNTVAQYELGRNEPVDAVFSLICREFDVNEEWLRTGEGEMFKPKPSDVLDQMAYKYQFSNADYVLVEKFVSLSPNKRNELVRNVFDFLHEAEAALSDTEPYALAYAGNEPPQPMDKLMESIKAQKNENTTHEMSVEQAEAEYIKKISAVARKEESTASNTTPDIRKLSNE